MDRRTFQQRAMMGLMGLFLAPKWGLSREEVSHNALPVWPIPHAQIQVRHGLLTDLQLGRLPSAPWFEFSEVQRFCRNGFDAGQRDLSLIQLAHFGDRYALQTIDYTHVLTSRQQSWPLMDLPTSWIKPQGIQLLRGGKEPIAVSRGVIWMVQGSAHHKSGSIPEGHLAHHQNSTTALNLWLTGDAIGLFFRDPS